MSIALPAIPTPYIHSTVKRRKNTWYSIADGNWSNRNIWISNSFRKFNYPQAGDDVYINHNVVVDTTTMVNNLRIAGKLTFPNSISVSVNGDIQAVGTVDMSGVNCNLILYGVNNSIVNFIGGSTCTVFYARNGDQPIMGIDYNNLVVCVGGRKYLTSNLTAFGFVCSGDTILTTVTSVYFDVGDYNLTVNGMTYTPISGSNWFLFSGNGNLLFKGLFKSYAFGGGTIVTGSPNIEFRGGMTTQAPVDFRSASVSFTTNNQEYNAYGTNANLFTNVTIQGDITLTIASGLFNLYGALNGTSTLSTLSNKAAFNFYSIGLPMVTGVFDYLTYPSSVGYVMNGNYNLPFVNYRGLQVGGTGYKYAQGNMTIDSFLGATLELVNYNLTVNLTTNGTISKTGSGNILFIGIVSGNLLTGATPVEFRGGINNLTAASTGTGTWSFTTNNQEIDGNAMYNISNPILIKSITLTIGVGSSNFAYPVFSGVLNGYDGSSSFVNALGRDTIPGYRGEFHYQNPSKPMVTGIFDSSAIKSNFYYDLSGDQDIRGGTYYNLTIGGSGVKTLQGNITVLGTYSVTGTATLNLNGYTKT